MATVDVPSTGHRIQALRAAAVAAVVLALVVLVLPQLPVSATSNHRWQTPLPYVVLGLIQGMVYGLLAVGLVIIYRSNRIINFAHGQIGAFGAALFGVIVGQWHVPYYLALVPAVLATAVTAAAAEVVVIRRLRQAPPLMSIVATLGVGTVLLLFAALFNAKAGAGALFPQPPGLPTFMVGELMVTASYLAMLTLSPIVVVALALFLKYSRFGLAIRAASANPDAARMSGIFTGRMSGLAWALAGATAAFGAILTAPTQGFASGESFGPSLLLRALAAAVLARMSSLPVAFAGGIGLGILESLLMLNFADPGVVELALMGFILVTMLLQRQHVGRAEEKGSWASVQGVPPLPEHLQEIWLVRNLGALTAVAAVAVLAVLPMFVSNSTSVELVGICGFVIVGLSVGIVTGLSGQLSLGQFALAGIGAVVSYHVARQTGNYVLAFTCAGLAASVVALVIGLPALRVKGLLLTVTTLSFALVVPSYLLRQSWAFGQGRPPGAPAAFGQDFTAGNKYYFVALICLVLAVLLARNVHRSGVGRLLVAVRDNEDAARAMSISAATIKLQGFAIAGFLAGLGGAMYAHGLSFVGPSTFPASVSIAIVVMTVIGGVGRLAGPMLGALLVFVLPEFGHLDSFALFANAVGQLLIIMYLPSGLGHLITPVRDSIAEAIGRRSRRPPEAEGPNRAERKPPAALASVRERTSTPSAGPLLQAVNLAKSFGGVHAVRGVSFDVRAGETVGLIGPNGAGKTTTFELLAGFTEPDEGTVRFADRDVTRHSPEARARLGLIRSFQDAALFPTLTVTECVQLALERVDRTRTLSALAGMTRQDRRKQENARNVVEFMGLGRYRSTQIRALSTGTRRISEIACLVALEPRLILLDEPAAGIAQRETEALGQLLIRLRRELDLTLVVIEHDIPMIMGISDRIIAMAEGIVIAEGEPAVVRNTPAVIDAYLGGGLVAIERSGAGVDGAVRG
jgi:ABC-type branched-subunit amino acid transport system ATPase component/ABC-type branched-subunit amino acid transport system permease subunit